MFKTSIELTSPSFKIEERYERRNPNTKNILETDILPVFIIFLIDDPVDINSSFSDTTILIGAINNTPKIIALNTFGYFSKMYLITLANITRTTITLIQI